MKGKTLVMFHNPPAITADDIADSNIKVNQIEACCVNMTPPAWISPNTGSIPSQNYESKVVFAIAFMIFNVVCVRWCRHKNPTTQWKDEKEFLRLLTLFSIPGDLFSVQPESNQKYLKT